MKIIDNDSHYRLVESAHSARPTSAGCSNYSTEWRISMDKMHLKIVEIPREKYVIQAAQNTIILYFEL